MISASLQRIDPEKRYTVWSKHPHRDMWMLERSFYGNYILYGEGEFYLESPAFMVTAAGADPNVTVNPSKLRVGKAMR